MMSRIKCSVLLAMIMVSLPGLAYKKDPEYNKARRSGALAQMKLCISNDMGTPIHDASVHVLMGMNFREHSYNVEGKTDTNGLFVVEGKTTGNEIIIEVTKDGYYKSSQKLCFIKMGSEYEVSNGKWQPWGMAISMTLREVRAPVPLVVQQELYKMPATNTLVGFDMAVKDWVSPNGKGKHADFEVFLTWDGKPLYYTRHTQLDVRFLENHAGCYVFDNIKGSQFGGPYRADTNRTFQTEFSCTSSYENGEPSFRGLDVGRSLIVRSRCKVDNDGHLVSANYSTIKNITVEAGWAGEVMMMIRYYFNPTPNDTNLEPKRESAK